MSWQASIRRPRVTDIESVKKTDVLELNLEAKSCEMFLSNFWQNTSFRKETLAQRVMAHRNRCEQVLVGMLTGSF